VASEPELWFPRVTEAMGRKPLAAHRKVREAGGRFLGREKGLAASFAARARSYENLETRATIIHSSGLAVKKTPARKPRVFAAKEGALSGAVKLVTASAGPRSSYEWEYSLDGGETWVAVAPTIQARTTVPGLTPGVTVQFRYRTVTKAGAGDWSQTVALMVK